MPEDFPAQERSRFVDDLLSYMTLEEKLGQLNLEHSTDDPALEREIAAGRVGGLAGADMPVRLQALASERSRLGIPLLLASPSVDLGLSPWALAASWDEELLQSLGASAARAAIAGGFACVRAPVCSASVDNSRLIHIAATEPHLTARLAAAFARGAQGEGADQRSAALAVAAWTPGADKDGLAWAAQLLQAEGVAAIDCAAIGREMAQRSGFDGIVFSECRRIRQIVARHFRQTSARSVLESAERTIAEGVVSEHEIDLAVRGVLSAKHRLGLFRDLHRVVAEPATGLRRGRDDQKVRGTFVLLRNEAGLLPFSPVSDRILVVGSPDGVAPRCADALGRAGIAHSVVPGLAQRRADESWASPVPGDHFALSLGSDAARRADFVLVALEDRHFSDAREARWRRPTPAVLAMLRAFSLAQTRMVAIVATAEPVDLADADQHFAAVLQCWQPTAGFEEALSDVLSGRYSPQGRMPAGSGRYLAGHGLGYGESVVTNYTLTAGGYHAAAAVTVRNSGSFPMRETIQVYVRESDGGLRLVAFQEAHLPAGEERSVAFDLGVDALGLPGPSGRVEMAPGRYEILVGKSLSRLLSATIEVTPALARAMISRDRGFLRLAAG